MCVTVVNLMDDIIYQYGLAPFSQVGSSLTSIRLVVATSTSIYSYHNANWDSPAFSVNAPSSQTISALTAISTIAGNLLAFITHAGQLHLLDDRGTCLERRQLSQSPLWSITSAQIGQRPLLFITAADSTIHVCDTQGELLGTIETPAPVFSLAIKQINGQTILCGGLQNQNRVCIWNLHAMVQNQDATPVSVLRGGDDSAFATTFIEVDDSIWLAHGCWDNQIYLYHWSPGYGRKVTRAFLKLRATEPIYSLQAIIFQDTRYLLAGTANGDILAWDISAGANTEPIRVTRLATLVKHMKAVRLGEQWYLFVGGGNGRLTIFHLTHVDSPEIIATLTVNDNKVQGIEIV